jgi:hypothetical protein
MIANQPPSGGFPKNRPVVYGRGWRPNQLQKKLLARRSAGLGRLPAPEGPEEGSQGPALLLRGTGLAPSLTTQGWTPPPSRGVFSESPLELSEGKGGTPHASCCLCTAASGDRTASPQRRIAAGDCPGAAVGAGDGAPDLAPLSRPGGGGPDAAIRALCPPWPPLLPVALSGHPLVAATASQLGRRAAAPPVAAALAGPAGAARADAATVAAARRLEPAPPTPAASQPHTRATTARSLAD